MNIQYLSSNQELQHTLDQYNNNHDRIFYITQESILLESSFINKVITNYQSKIWAFELIIITIVFI